MTNKFTENAKKALSYAVSSVKDLGHTYVGSEHLLLGVISDGESFSSYLLYNQGLTVEKVRSQIIELAGIGIKNIIGGEDMTPKCKKIIMSAEKVAKAQRLNMITTEHILMAIIREECVAKRIIEMEGIAAEELVMNLENYFGKSDYEIFDIKSQKDFSAPTPVTDKNACDLTAKAKNGEIEPITGREKEEERLIRILLRKTKNNPCLIGEAGVGKTAVAESLALRIAQGRVPEELKNSRIMSLDMSVVVAGTKYRGEFEEKLKNIINEVKNDKNIILFIDEIHTIAGAGAAEGSVDAANILKPPLARGDIKVIGATTPKEYKRIIEKDGALERRFQPVYIEEPSETQCEKMLLKTKKHFEKHHGITITDEAVKTAVDLSARYIRDRFLPDKAIDLLDEASSYKYLESGKESVLCGGDVAKMAEESTGIPLSTLTQNESERFMRLEKVLEKEIVGQKDAIRALCSAARRARTGLHEGGKPIGSFLFLGKSGVGKTFAAKLFAEQIGGSSQAFVKIDMSEFSEKHSVSGLIGSPPGYVGYGEGGSLTEKIRRRPYSIVLFDEIEKAHPEVSNLLLQILDDGSLTDSTGLKVSFKNTFIIMTSNIGYGENSVKTMGFLTDKNDAIKKSLTKHISAELLDRIDEVILFSPLSDDNLLEIAINECKKISCRLKNIKLEFDSSYLQYIKEKITSEKPSARKICTNVKRDCENLLANEIFFMKDKSELSLICDKGVLTLKEKSIK